MTKTLVPFLVLFGALVGAQGTRDPNVRPLPPKGSAELSVVVTADDQDGRPLRRVSVSIQAGELDVPNIAVTNDEGRVIFRNLAPGNYLLTAFRNGYVRTYYGSKLPGRGPGIPVTVLTGQKAADIRIRMLRGSVITGTVRTTSGRPAPYQQVQAIMVRSGGGDRRAVNIENNLGIVTSDDRGVYRIFGLAPGDYIVLAPATLAAVEEMRAVTTAQLRWADSVVAGGATGAPASGVPAAPAGAAPVAYAPVYFPGTSSVNEAAVITLGPNEERAGLDFSLQFVPTAQVSGRLVDSDGRPQNGVTVTLRPLRHDGLDLFSSLFNATGRTAPDGMFIIRGVKPGAYTLSARATPKTGAEAPLPPPSTPQEAMARAQQEAGASIGGSGTHWASDELTVQGRDISDLVLTLRPGMTMSGKVVYEAVTKTPPTDFSKTGLMLMAAPTGTGISDLMATFAGGGAGMPAKFAADGTFTIQGVAPGRYRFNTPFAMMPFAGLPTGAMLGGWTLKSVMLSGRDIADAPLEVKPGVELYNVVITFTDQPSELSGTVIDGAGRVTPDFPIVVFSTDRAYWTLGSRRVQTARPSSDGRFKITGLPAGEYFVCAVTMVDRTEVYDPAFLAQLAASSFKLTIKDGEKKTVDLKLGGG